MRPRPLTALLLAAGLLASLAGGAGTALAQQPGEVPSPPADQAGGTGAPGSQASQNQPANPPGGGGGNTGDVLDGGDQDQGGGDTGNVVGGLGPPPYEQPEEGPAAAPAGEGLAQLMPAPDLRGGNEPTAFERFATEPLQLTHHLGITDQTDKALNGLAGLILEASKAIGRLVATVVQWAFTLDVFDSLGTVVDQTVGTLWQDNLAGFLPVVVITAGLWMVWQLLARSRQSIALQGGLWTVAALAAATAFMARPSAIIGPVNDATVQVSRAILGTAAGLDPNPGVSGVVLEEQGSYAGDPADQGARVAADQLYRELLVVPWGVMEFGSLDKAGKWGPRLADALHLADGENPEEEQRKYEELKNEVEKDEAAWAWFSGKRAHERVGLAALGLLATLIVGGVVLAIALAVFLAQLGLLLLVMLSPIMLLLGAHPGARRVTLRWVEACAGALLKRIGYAALLAVLVVAFGALYQVGSGGIGWGITLLLQLVLAGAAFIYRGKFSQIFAEATPVGEGDPTLAFAGGAAAGAGGATLADKIGDTARGGGGNGGRPTSGGGSSTSGPDGGKVWTLKDRLGLAGGAGLAAGGAGIAGTAGTPHQPADGSEPDRFRRDQLALGMGEAASSPRGHTPSKGPPRRRGHRPSDDRPRSGPPSDHIAGRPSTSTDNRPWRPGPGARSTRRQIPPEEQHPPDAGGYGHPNGPPGGPPLRPNRPPPDGHDGDGDVDGREEG